MFDFIVEGIAEIAGKVLLAGIAIGLVIAALVFGVGYLVVSNQEPDQVEEMQEVLAEYPNAQVFIEGVVVGVMPEEDGFSLVKFDNGTDARLKLGSHEVHIGEWNQIRFNAERHVEEVFLGEGTMEELARE